VGSPIAIRASLGDDSAVVITGGRMGLEIGRRTLRGAARAATGRHRLPSVVIVGAGLSGLAMGIQLVRSGLSTFTIVEQSDGVGGTWRDNTYPGCSCDVPSHLYSFSFAPKADWSRRYAEQPEILGYAERCVEEFGLGPHLRLGTHVTSARFDEDRGDWELELAPGDGPSEVLRADAVVFACGQLNVPHVPALPGVSSFAGPMWHSARWDHECDVGDKRVAVIGNGASAIQFVPVLAEAADGLVVFVRSPNYVVPKKDRVYGARAHRLLERMAVVERVYRWSIYWRLEAGWFFFRRDTRASRALSGLVAKAIRDRVVSDRLPEDAVVPDYPIGCKRILLSSDWYPAISRPDVEVVDQPIDHVEPDAVVTADGRRHQVDVLVFGTGFESTDFLGHLPVTGRHGRTLRQEWEGGARAYLGTAVPDFPNCYLLYGPNTNLGHNSILFMVERQINLVLQALAVQTTAMREAENPLVGVDRAAYETDDRRTQRMMTRTAWVAACHSWYKDAAGRVTNNWPTWTVRYWLDTLRLRPSDVGVTATVPDRGCAAVRSADQEPMCDAGTVPSRPA
jgi:cation diffusion facilitator CzcD-associated flavoprotein CzcO